MKTVHLVDVCAVFFRFYFSPAPEYLTDEGWDVSSLISMIRWFCKKEFFTDDMVVLAFDESLGTGFRHKIDENYKANRALPTDDIIYQLTLLKSIAQYLGFVVLASNEFEADDLIASSVDQLPEKNCIVYSRDKDLKQLLKGNVSLLDFANGTVWTPDSLYSEMTIEPSQIPLYLALVGDSSDNIQGVVGVGDKTARYLLQEGRNWPELLQFIRSGEALGIRGEARIKGGILESVSLIEKNLSLTQLRVDAPISFKREALTDENWQILNALLEQLNLQRLLKKHLGLISGYVI